jgi:hypothetical protein
VSAAFPLIIAAASWLLAALLGAHELRAYRSRRGEERDLFAYTHRRLVYRLTGVAALLAFGATLAIWEMVPPRSPGAAVIYLLLFALEVVALLLIAMLDMRETRRTADPLAKRHTHW